MTRAIAGALAAGLLLATGPALAQVADGTTEGTATQPREPAAKPGTVNQPKADPKLLIDLFNRLTRPRQPAPPPLSAPMPAEPAAPVAADPLPEPAPMAIPVPPRRRQPPATEAPVSRDPKAAPSAVPQPAPPARLATPAAPPEPTIVEAPEPAAAAVPPARIAPVAPVHPTGVAEPAQPPPQRTALLLSQSGWIILALLLILAAAVGAAAWNRARRIARTRAALSLEPRLDLADGSCSVGGGGLACPPMSIRTRLEFAGA